MLPSLLAGLQELSELEQANKAIPKWNGQSNFQADEATHVIHTLRGSQWEPQALHHSVPPSDVQKYGSDADLSRVQTTWACP